MKKDFHCPHDGAVLARAIDYCPVCDEEFTDLVGTAIKQRIERDTVARIVKWLRTPQLGTLCEHQERDNGLADAIERGEWKRRDGR